MFISYSVQFVGYVIQDEYTEYHLKVKSSTDNATWLVRRRYREFRDLHDILKLVYPESIPAVPGKKLWGNQDPDFVRLRQDQLQVYMNGILALEPDCRSLVLQRFLDIKKQMIHRSVSSAPVPEVTASPSVPSTPPLAVSKNADLNQIVEALKKDMFDLSLTPSLLDAGEYASRRKKYEEILLKASVVGSGTKTPPGSVSKLQSQGVLGALSEAAFFPIGAMPDAAKQGINSILGESPIASEHDLVAFFSMKLAPHVPTLASSSSC